MRKYGTGEILKDEDDAKKTANVAWTDQDREDLEKENKEQQ